MCAYVFKKKTNNKRLLLKNNKDKQIERKNNIFAF
jgi:hypothetical protein